MSADGKPPGANRRAIELAAAAGISPKRSFGQNFLRDPNLARRIAALATEREGGTVVEIGAGLGALTEPLLERAGRVVAIERDRDLVPILREAFGDRDGLEVVEADGMTFDVAAAFADGPSPRVLAGNLPYQLSGGLLERAVTTAPSLDRAVFMLQREVVDRLCAAPGGKTYGALSVFVQAAFSPRMAFRVGPGAFYPPPRVGSAVVVLERLPEPRAVEDDALRAVVKAAFGQRRKKLRNAWRALGPPDDVAAMAAAAGIDLDLRAEVLPVESFAAMATQLRQRPGHGSVP